METVEEMFRSYLKSAYPGGPLEGTQLQEVRRAFYAGVMGGLGIHALRGLAREELVNQWIMELDAFKESALRGEK